MSREKFIPESIGLQSQIGLKTTTQILLYSFQMWNTSHFTVLVNCFHHQKKMILVVIVCRERFLILKIPLWRSISHIHIFVFGDQFVSLNHPIVEIKTTDEYNLLPRLCLWHILPKGALSFNAVPGKHSRDQTTSEIPKLFVCLQWLLNIRYKYNSSEFSFWCIYHTSIFLSLFLYTFVVIWHLITKVVWNMKLDARIDHKSCQNCIWCHCDTNIMLE